MSQAHGAKTSYRLSGRELAMLFCCAGAPFMTMLDTNIVAVSLPSIARDLRGEFTDIEWVVSAYVLPFAGLLMPAGALADRWGRKRMLYAGLALFTLASVLCGLAPNLPLLNVARALQAVGGALQLTASLAVIAHGFAPAQRARVYAIWATVMGMAPAFGAIIGGLITTYLGWRWAFLINLPTGLILMAIGWRSVRESRDPLAGRLDVPGMLLFGAALLLIVWPLIEANRVGWSSPHTLIKLAIGVLLLVVFGFVEQRHPRPMIDLTLFKDPSVVGAAIAMLGYAAAAMLMMTILPIYLQDSSGKSAAEAGLAMIPFALPLLAGPTLGARLGTRLGSRAMLTLGLAMVAIGDAILAAVVFAGLGYGAVVFGMVIVGLATGVLNSETTKAQVVTVPSDRAGMASGIAATTRFIGITIGFAGLGAVLTTAAESKLRMLGKAVVPDSQIDWHALSLRIVGGDANSVVSDLPHLFHAEMLHVIDAGVASGFAATFAAAAIVAVISSVLSWCLVREDRAVQTEQSEDAVSAAEAEGEAID